MAVKIERKRCPKCGQYRPFYLIKSHIEECGGKLSGMEILRRIVLNRQAERVHGLLVDLFTASAMLAVYDALNADNQAKFAALLDADGVRKLARFAINRVKIA